MMRIQLENGTVLTLEQVQQGIMAITDSEELLLFGRPMPSLTDSTHRITVAKRVPGRDRFESFYAEFGRELLGEENAAKYVNSWNVMGHEVIVCRDDKGIFAIRMPHAHWKLADVMKANVLRFGAVTAKAEIQAMKKLAEYVSDPQYDNYILSNAFIETSKRSEIKYMFRKGKPTLAFRATADDGMKCLAALCFHPLGYYEGTSCGCMAPTDEVIAHLTMMRGDEHYYWRKSNQHRTWDPRSGL